MKVDELIKKKMRLQKELSTVVNEINKITNLDKKACETVYSTVYNDLCEMNIGDLAEELAFRSSYYELCTQYMDNYEVYDLDPKDMTDEDIVISKALNDYHARAILLGDDE